MTTAYTPILGLALPVEGELDGTWGDVVNDSITSLVEDAVANAATYDVSAGNWTLSTTAGTTNQARMAILIPTGTPGVSRNIIAPETSKLYVVINQSDANVVLKGATTTGITLATGTYALAAWNGSDFVRVGRDGTVTTTSVVSANGFAGTVANASTTPAITLSTTVTGILKGNGTAISAAVAGTDYGTVTTASVVSANGFAGTVANASTTPAITLSTSVTGVAKGNGTALSAATAGSDYVAPGTATTFTAKQTFTGTTSNIGISLQAGLEKVNVAATAATGTVNFNVNTAAVWYYTSNASGNWTLNIRGDGTTNLNDLMATGESTTIAFMVTQGSTAYYNTTVQIDGNTAGVTTKWQGGTAPTEGNASGIDVYSYTIVKTGSSTYTVLAAQTQFK